MLLPLFAVHLSDGALSAAWLAAGFAGAAALLALGPLFQLVSDGQRIDRDGREAKPVRLALEVGVMANGGVADAPDDARFLDLDQLGGNAASLRAPGFSPGAAPAKPVSRPLPGT